MRIAPVPAALLLVTSLFALPAAAASPLDGEWVLVEQTYGDGETNLADLDARLRLRIGASEAPDLVRIVLEKDGETHTARWPAYEVRPGDDTPAEVSVRDVDAGAGRLHAHYRVRPNEHDGLILDIDENYRLDADTGRLAGELRVSFLYDGEPRGGYVIHRRFERAGP